MCQELQEAALLPGLALGMVWNAAGPVARTGGSGEPSLMAPGGAVSLDGSVGRWHLSQSWLMRGLKEFVTRAVLWEGLFDL